MPGASARQRHFYVIDFCSYQNAIAPAPNPPKVIVAGLLSSAPNLYIPMLCNKSVGAGIGHITLTHATTNVSRNHGYKPCRNPPQTKNDIMFAPMPGDQSPLRRPSFLTICFAYVTSPGAAEGSSKRPAHYPALPSETQPSSFGGQWDQQGQSICQGSARLLCTSVSCGATCHRIRSVSSGLNVPTCKYKYMARRRLSEPYDLQSGDP